MEKDFWQTQYLNLKEDYEELQLENERLKQIIEMMRQWQEFGGGKNGLV